MILLAGAICCPWSDAKTVSSDFEAVLPQLEAALGGLSADIDQFEVIQSNLDESGRANADYNEQKNIFLSSILSIGAISAICEYERDLLTLFLDMREKNRMKYHQVRIESLEASVKQIEIMHKQIQINLSILPPDFYEKPLLEKETETILSVINRLKSCITHLRSIRVSP
jgi:hypothetical protein